MKIIAVNGSPRKNGNTATLCKEFLKGTELAENKVETEIINLYDLTYTGCKSCFSCKKNTGNTYGKCLIKDDLQDILGKVANADGIVFGSPIYLGGITAQLRGFLERLIFPFVTYEAGYKTIEPKKMPVAMIYTMNVTENVMKKSQYDKQLSGMEGVIERVFAKPEIFYGFNTYQFDNYANYKVEVFSEAEKAEYKKLQFPIDCKNVLAGGKRMVMKIIDKN